ncbi:MAG: hypothetical protein Q4C55_00825 [Eubacterium sp.]|nr:hypothetical protein [Eubacterium sp.]
MAYCPKCGVEVDNDVKNCPLCGFPIPDIGEAGSGERRYPLAVNTYPEDHRERKNKIFYSLEILCLAMLCVGLVLELVFGNFSRGIRIFLAADVALACYLLFAFGYLRPWLNFIGFYLTTLGLGYFIYRSGVNPVDWFTCYLLPIATLAYLDLNLFLFIYRKNRRKNQFIFVPVTILGFTILLTLGIDATVSYNLLGHISLRWSLIVLVSCMAIIVVLMGLYYGAPEKTKAYLKKKLHV